MHVCVTQNCMRNVVGAVVDVDHNAVRGGSAELRDVHVAVCEPADLDSNSTDPEHG